MWLALCSSGPTYGKHISRTSFLLADFFYIFKGDDRFTYYHFILKKHGGSTGRHNGDENTRKAAGSVFISVSIIECVT